MHPDDEFSSFAVNGEADARRYDVFISLTTGEDTTYCTGKNVSNPYMSIEYLPQPQPTGLPFSDRCKKHRMDSWNTFLSNVKDGASLAANYTQTWGDPVTFGGRSIPTPTRDSDGNNHYVTATDFKYWIGSNQARFEFDLGELSSDKIIWAIENVRKMIGEFPTQTEGDIVGSGYFNDSGTGTQYLLPDHEVMYNTMRTVDFGLPGSQYAPIGHYQSGRAFGAWVTDYCSYMCHPYSVTSYTGTLGRLQYAYGWLRDGRWSAADYDDVITGNDVAPGFTSYQSFGKWF